MLPRGALALLLLALGACATIPDITQSRSPCRMEPGGWCEFVREIAVESYPYAIAATSAYQGDDDIYPDDRLGVALERVERLEIDQKDLNRGFGYQVFDQYDVSLVGTENLAQNRPVRGDFKARIIAFRGTDFGAKDVFYGTLRKGQAEIALRYFDRERARPEAADIDTWIVTGHSLGGALATEVSARYPGVKAWMFNTSPFIKADPDANDANRTAINERGDWLRSFRKYDTAPASRLLVLNCAPQNNSVTKHSIRLLSDCVTWIAAYGNYDALGVVQANSIGKPPVECGPADKKHPGVGYFYRPCAHIARTPKDD